MIDLAAFRDDVILSTTEIHAWTSRPKKAILASRMPPVAMVAREKHYRAGDVKQWVLIGDRAFDAPVADAVPAPRRPLQFSRARGA